MTRTVLILGPSGKIGRHSARAFRAAGWTVRLFDRTRDDLNAAARGADVIVNGLNPPNYHDWARQVPAITARVIAAASAVGATVILPGNVYNFGDRPGVWDENTPHRATTAKGRIRIAAEAAYRDAGVRTIVLRAGNFIVPDGDDDMMGQLYLRSIRRGRVTAAGRADAMQAYAYVPDWARAAVALADMRDRLAQFEDVPFPGHSFTANELRDGLSGILGTPLRLARFPWMVLRLAAPFWELAREMREMRYLFDTDHRLSGEKFARLLPDFRATELATVMTAALPADLRPDQRMAAAVAV